MTQHLPAHIAAAIAAAQATAPDMTETTSGGGGGRLLPAGYAFGRLVEYVEYGLQPQEFGGKAKDPVMDVQLGFALWGVEPTSNETYHNDDGSPSIVRLFPFALGRNEKSRAVSIFNALNWKGTSKNFASMLGEPILVKIVHEAKSKTDSTIVSRIDIKGFLPPLDPVTRAPYQIPEAPADAYRVFIWDFPTKEAWDALEITGKRDDGTSKNVIQEKMLKALNYEGSPLCMLLGGKNPNVAQAPGVAASAPLAQPLPDPMTVAAGNCAAGAGAQHPPSSTPSATQSATSAHPTTSPSNPGAAMSITPPPGIMPPPAA